jgi:predicted DNA-binding transcriptional regulator YafY
MTKKRGDNFIKDYEKIRPILREFFLYGCFSRDDFAMSKICARKYDNELRIIRNTLPPETMEEAIVDKKKYVRLMYDMFRMKGNFLHSTFRIKELDTRGVALFLHVLQCLALYPGMKRTEIYDQLPVTVDYATLFRHLQSFCKMGILQEKRIKNTSYYYISDPFENFTQTDFLTLYEGVLYFANVLPLSIPGYTLLDAMRAYAYSKGWSIGPDNIPFQFKNLHMQRVLDEEEMWFLLQAIHQRSIVSFEYCRSHRIGEAQKIDWITVEHIAPIKILSDDFYGRRTLIGALLDDHHKIRSFRLERIRKLKCSGSLAESEDYTQNYARYIHHSWCFSGREKASPLIMVELKFHLNPENEAAILQRVRREGRHGAFKKIGEYCWLYQIQVKDSREMKPWIRSFTGYVEVMPSDQHHLRSDMQAEQKELSAYYESLQSISK